MPTKRLLWISDNGKYKVLVRGSDDGPITGFWKLSEGKALPVRYKDLPQYVKDKIRELESRVMFKGGNA